MTLPIPDPIIPSFISKLLAVLGFPAFGREATPYYFVMVTIASWPIAYGLRYVKSRFFRLLISLLTGVALLALVYGIPLATSLIAYPAVFYIPIRYNWFAPSMITIIDMVFVLSSHYDSMITGTSTDRFSYTGTVMILAAKISMTAYHLNDGRVIKSGNKLTEHFQEREKSAIVSDPPNFFEYMSYMLDFFGGAVGPVLRYKEYMSFMSRSGEFAQIDSVSITIPFLKSFGRCTFLLGLYVALQQFPVLHQETLISEWFGRDVSLIPRVLMAAVIIAICRLAFYAVWSLTEVTCVVAGIAYDAEAPLEFTGTSNTSILKFESSQNVNQLTGHWNIRISKLWLKQCIYERVTYSPKGWSKKGFANLVTKLTSAFWHGWYPGYVLSFVSLGLGNWTETVFRKKVHPHVPHWLLHSKASSVVAWTHTWITGNAFFGPFLLLTWEKTKVYYYNVGLACVMYHLILIFVGTYLVPLKKEVGHSKKVT